MYYILWQITCHNLYQQPINTLQWDKNIWEKYTFSKYSCSTCFQTKEATEELLLELVLQHASMFWRKCFTCIIMKHECAWCLQGWWAHCFIISGMCGPEVWWSGSSSVGWIKVGETSSQGAQDGGPQMSSEWIPINETNVLSKNEQGVQILRNYITLSAHTKT